MMMGRALCWKLNVVKSGLLIVVRFERRQPRKVPTVAYTMPMWALEGELIKVNAFLHPGFDENDVRDLFGLWGGSPRYAQMVNVSYLWKKSPCAQVLTGRGPLSLDIQVRSDGGHRLKRRSPIKIQENYQRDGAGAGRGKRPGGCGGGEPRHVGPHG